ncbi:MAG: hypothetical protein K8S97_03070 [Anaerolineae bacterium]|nr:hypothetical protein [Anaerolineae bacterium]
MMRRAWWMLVSLLLALVCYYLPWYAHDTAGFTMHGFDLAEWTSLHPAVRSRNPELLTSFLLRAPQWILVAALALTANRLDDARWRWIVRAGALALALRFVPPKEFFTDTPDDPNYRQMTLLLVLSGLSVLLAMLMFRLPERVQHGVLITLLIAGVVMGWWGLSRTGELLDNFEIDVRIGVGIVGYTLCATLAGLIAMWPRDMRMWPRRQSAQPVQRAL